MFQAANMSCKDCNSSIINQQASIIPDPRCAGNCPEDVVCTDVLASNCVYYNGSTLECITDPTSNSRPIQNGDSITTVLQTLNNAWGPRVSASDTCCGFLSDKIVSSNPSLLRVSVQTLSGCQRIVLTPSASQTSPCAGKVQVNTTDTCGFLVNKVSSDDSSITITDNSTTTGKLDLSVPCAGKVLVDNITNFQDSCDYLSSKFTDGDITVLMTNGNSAQDVILNQSPSTNAPKIKISRLVKTFQWVGGSDAVNDPIILNGVHSTIVSGTLQHKGFVTINNNFPSGTDPIYDQTTGRFTTQIDGVYDISMSISMGSKSGGSLVAFNSIGDLTYGLLSSTNGCTSNCFTLISQLFSVSTSQNIVYGTAFQKGVNMSSYAGNHPYFALYILNNIAAMTNNGSEFVINLSFEKTGSL